MTARKASKLAAGLGSSVFYRRIREALWTNVVSIPLVSFASQDLDHLVIANRALDERAVIVIVPGFRLDLTPRKIPASLACATKYDLSSSSIVSTTTRLNFLLESHRISTSTALGKLCLHNLRRFVAGTKSWEMPRHSFVQLVRFGTSRLEDGLHLCENRDYDIVLCLLPSSHLITLGLYLSAQVGLVQLVSHAVVSFHKSNPQGSRRETLIGISTSILAVLNCRDMLSDRRVGSDSIAVHQRDELDLGEGPWRSCSSFFQHQGMRCHPTANLKMGNFSLSR
jgi:hypothetical protein